jgi:proteasome activator subunit 4
MIAGSIAIARAFVYSIAVDGPIRGESTATPQRPGQIQAIGYLAGSKALDSLEKLITSTETLFHPSTSSTSSSNVGHFPELY